MTLCCAGCGDDEAADVSSSPFAIEAWIDNGGYPVVMVSRAVRPSGNNVDVADAMVRWAKVTVSDGDTTVVLTGGVDHGVFPPYSYRSYAVKGEVGRRYSISVEYDGVKAYASSDILPPPSITGADFVTAGDGLYSGTLSYETPAAADSCCLVVFTRVIGIDSRHYPGCLGTAKAPGGSSHGVVPLSRGKHSDSLEPYTPNFSRGDTVDVLLARVTPQVYDFWCAYQQQVYFGNNIFVSASDTPVGNVVGGYGVFSARGISRMTVVVR